MTTVALIYTRVSSEEQAREGLSLEAQLAECRKYAAGRAAAHDWVLGREFQDILRGTRDDRPEYQALLAEVRALRAAGRRVAVVVAALDRLGRAILERVRSREELKALGVPTHSVREGGEVSDLVANVLASVAQEEVRRLSERVSASWRHTTGLGWFMVGRAPWGYRWRPATAEERAEGAPRSVLEADPATAPYIIEAFERATRQSVRSVARWVAGLPTEARGGRPLEYRVVRRTLQSPVYAARPYHGGDDALGRAVGRWPVLVDDATWLAVQDRIARHKRLPAQASGAYALSGLLRCPVDGARMSGWRQHGPARLAYRCANTTLKRCRCVIPCRLLDGPVLAEVTALVEAVAASDPGLRAELRRAWQALRRPAAGDEVRRRVQALEREVERARKRRAAATLLLLDGTLDRAAYDEAVQAVQADFDRAEAELARLRGVAVEPALPPLEDVLREAGGWAEALRAADTPAQREVLGLLVERVIPERVGYGKYDVTIDWSPLGRGLRRLAAGVAAGAAA